MNRTKLREELRRDEGERLHAYRDSVGIYTIGVGHMLGTSPRMLDITPGESAALLERDIDNAEALAWSLIQNADVWANDLRSRALINMAFNLGNRLAAFEKFLTAVSASDWEQAAVEMLNSKWAGQVGDRATRLAQMIATGAEIVETA